MTAYVLPVVESADHVPGPPQGRWTYTSYAAVPDDGQRYEVIDGVLYMVPALTSAHQATAARILFYLLQHIEFADLGRVFISPIDVELAPSVVVQPDLLVILKANEGVITPSHIDGAPDLVIEIVSPSTAGYDRRNKQDSYACAGVPEYWLVAPTAGTVEILRLERDIYCSMGVVQGDAPLPSQVLPVLPIRVEQFFR